MNNKSALDKAIEADEQAIADLARENEQLRARINARTEAIQNHLANNDANNSFNSNHQSSDGKGNRQQ